MTEAPSINTNQNNSNPNESNESNSSLITTGNDSEGSNLPGEGARLTLKPASIDPYSVKIQMIFAGLATLAVCLVSYSATLQVGFLLDDFLHIDYIARALQGDWHDFLHNFYGNWANSPLMQSYRPLVSVSLFLDYLFWNSNAWGFHLSNILMLWGCSLMVGLIALELSGLRGNRMGACAAIWSVLLFAVYPLHVEASAWIIGRVDLLCSLLYLISIFSYLRFRLLREKGYFFATIGCFVAAMASKEMAVTLPAVITAAELLLYPLFNENANTPENRVRRQNWRIGCVGTVWAFMALFMTARFIMLNTLVGGYGGTGTTLHDLVARISDKGTIDRILFPFNLDILSRTGAWDLKETLVKVLKTAYLSVLASAIVRVFLQSMSLRIIAFLVIWLLIGITPTFQIWLISPNMVGSRLFFLSSAPFVILLAFLALPAIDAIKPKFAKALSVLGSIALLVIVSVWSHCLQLDQTAWTGASALLKEFKSDLLSNISEIPEDKKVLLLNLPSDYSGAGILTRGQYLSFLLAPPNLKEDFRKRAEVLAPDDRKSDFNFSEALEAKLKDEQIARILIWKPPVSREDGKLNSWEPDQTAEASQSVNIADVLNQAIWRADQGDSLPDLSPEKLQVLPVSKENQWTASTDGSSFRTYGTGLRIRPGNSGQTLVFAIKPLSTVKAKTAKIRAKAISGTADLQFIWFTKNKETGMVPFRLASGTDSDFLTLPLGTLSDWCFSGSVERIAIHFPKGDYEAELSALEID